MGLGNAAAKARNEEDVNVNVVDEEGMLRIERRGGEC
jgi:hypothetical protein